MPREDQFKPFDEIVSDNLLVLLDETKHDSEKLLAIANICATKDADVALATFYADETRLSQKIAIAAAMVAFENYSKAIEFLEDNANNPEVAGLVARLKNLIPAIDLNRRSTIKGKPAKKIRWNLNFIIALWKVKETTEKNGNDFREISRKAGELLNKMNITKRGETFYYQGNAIN